MRGQALAIFALSLTVVLLAAALAFDAGLIILERRDQQNAADAAAMAGARHITSNQSLARSSAADIATANGFTTGVDSQVVNVHIPPVSGQFTSWPNAIQVEILNTRPSLFAGIMGIANWPVSARAVAASFAGAGGPFAILALEPHDCEAVKVSGNGDITAYGNIQVNSDCPGSALKRQGPGSITVNASGAACNVAGGIQDGGGAGSLNCAQVTGAPVIPDPLKDLPDVPQQPYPVPPTYISGPNSGIPNGCQGGSGAATFLAPATCQFQSSYAGTTWRLHPGSYPGGLKLQAGTFYLEPGIYWLGGGGLDITGNGSDTSSVDAGTGTYGGGVLFYNTEIPTSTLGDIRLNGASANIHLMPLSAPAASPESTWNGLVVYQDRRYSLGGDDIVVDGNSSAGMDVRGTVYAPVGDVRVNGNAGQLTMDQIIALTFEATGAPGSQIFAQKEVANIFQFTAAGLVE